MTDPRPTDDLAARILAGERRALARAVTLVESDADALVGGLGRVAAHHESAVARGQLTKAGRDEQWGRLTGSIAIEELAAADMVIEAVPDDPALKQALFAELDGIAKGGAVLVSTTSCLDLNLLAAASKRSADVTDATESPASRASARMSFPESSLTHATPIPPRR